ncbi:GntR family transcriptional regulator [Ornithinibacillus sp. 4-3]|uniref:GntR family transcriptional regulator n=1 Tax=Ornithinibacillus sp. 4-3 TaxID=3231488 RepID=A0AB39HP73_9BACI
MGRILLSDVAYDRIKELLLNGDFNESISEGELVKMLNMSRTPIREALKRLTNEDFIKVYPNRGIFIKEVSIKETNDLLDLRLALETFTIEHIADKFTDEDLAFLEKNAEEQMQVRIQGDAFRSVQLDLEYHKYFFKILGNDHFIKVFNHLTDRLYLHGLKRTRKRGLTNIQSIKEHIGINKALKERDFKKARALLEEHIILGKENYFQN